MTGRGNARRALSEEFKYYRFLRFTQILFLGTELTDITDATVLLLIINRGAPCFQRNPCLKKRAPIKDAPTSIYSLPLGRVREGSPTKKGADTMVCPYVRIV
jgi:hypothetical protein